MKKGKLSINDIANSLRISKTSVSFILNGKAKEKRISDTLVKKVLDLVNEVGYAPNQFAQSLRTGKTRILGLMVEDISNPFFASIAKHIEETAYAYGHKIIYCSMENSGKRAQEFLNMFRNLGVDGYIITPPLGIENDIRELASSGAEVILLDRHIEGIPVPYVVVDNEEGMYKGATHLIDQGYRNIAFITLESQQPQMQGRFKGYDKAIKEHGLTACVHAMPFRVNKAEFVDDIEMFLRQQSHIDAVLFGANYLGVSGLEAIRRIGLKIPQDIAMVSFDDNDMFRLNLPSITAISQPIEQLSKAVITTLLENISTDDPEKRNTEGILIPTTLLVRESSAKKN